MMAITANCKGDVLVMLRERGQWITAIGRVLSVGSPDLSTADVVDLFMIRTDLRHYLPEPIPYQLSNQAARELLNILS